MASLSGLAAASGFLLIVGIVLALMGFVLVLALRGKSLKFSALTMGAGVIIVVASLALGAFVAPTGSTAPPPPPTAYVLVQHGSAPALQTGVTWNANTLTASVPLEYNKTSNGFVIPGAALVAGTSGKPSFFEFPISLIRSDAINETFSFPVSISSIFTQVALGSNPQTYSIVGYTPGTSSQTATWQAYFSAGTLANAKPTVTAPTTSTNVLSDPTAVQSFQSVTSTLHIALAGSNSTSAPTLFAEALTNNTGIMPVTVTIGNAVSQLPTTGAAATPGVVTVTIDFYLLGWSTI